MVSVKSYGKKSLLSRWLWRLSHPRKDYVVVSLAASRNDELSRVRL